MSKTVGKFILAFGGFFGLMILFTLGGSFYTGTAGYAGVKYRNGAIVDTIGPGWGNKLPWIETIDWYDIGVKTLSWDNIEFYTKDRQKAHMAISVSYQLSGKPDQLVCTATVYKSEKAVVDSIVVPKTLNATKIVVGQFDAADAVSKGAELTNQITTEIENTVRQQDPCGTGAVVRVFAVNIEGLKFDPEYEASIKDAMIAQVAVTTANNNADRVKAEAAATFNKAEGEAKAKERQATADAFSISAKGKAEAEAIALRGKALKENPEANPSLIIAQKWDGKLPTSMIPGSTVPFMAITPPQQ